MMIKLSIESLKNASYDNRGTILNPSQMNEW
jgi:hypothetical protein